MKSILQEDWGACYLCGRNRTADPCGLEEHHVFGGANRSLSEKYGLKIHVCGERCHRNGVKAVHSNAGTNRRIKEAAQAAFESVHGDREKFMQMFGKNYL